jgi:beta-glucosidase-like glycosyl hydrolase
VCCAGGRAQEVPGEDPYLTGEVGSYLIKATQEGGADPRYLSIASTMKHSPMYDMEGYNDGECESGDGACGKISTPTATNDYTCDTFELSGCNRRNFDSSPPVRDFAGYYTVAFKAISQRARPAAVMCAYPAAYGIPSCAHPFNNQVLREEWGWDGFIVSDCSAIELFEENFVFPPGANFSYGGHNYTRNSTDTVRAALVQGGTDADCPVSSNNFYSLYIPDALKTGAIEKADVDRAARRVFRTMFKLGMMDPMEDQPYVLSYNADKIDNAKSREVALRAATESIVLLKNSGAALPLTATSDKKFAFIGPHANSTQKLMSAPGYHGSNTLVDTHSPLQVARRRGWEVTYAKGCEICDNMDGKAYGNNPCRATPGEYNTTGFAAAVAAAKAADTVVLFLGADQTTEAEGFDRRTLGLVGAQQQLLEEVLAASTEVVLVMVNGGPVDISTAVESDKVVAILVRKTPFLGAILKLRTINPPRQARDKHTKS